MTYEQKCLELDKQLAELLGKWSDIEVVKQSLRVELWAEDGEHNLCTIPRWTQDDAEALRLAVEHELDIQMWKDFVRATWWNFGSDIATTEFFTDFPDRYSCIRYAIVQAVVNKLKANNA